MIVNILNHSNTQQKKIPNFCQITPTSYLINIRHSIQDKIYSTRNTKLLLLLFIDHTQNGTQYINIYNTYSI